MSERAGSDIERFLNWMMKCWIDSKSREDDFIQYKSPSMSVPTFTVIDSETEIAGVLTTLKN